MEHMKRPKKENYACVRSGCLEDLCRACEYYKLWNYVEYVEKKRNESRVELKKILSLIETQEGKWVGNIVLEILTIALEELNKDYT